MHPADINAALIKAGYNQTKIARELDISPNAVSLVIYGRSVSRRVAESISRVTRLPVAKLWPNKYDARTPASKAA